MATGIIRNEKYEIFILFCFKIKVTTRIGSNHKVVHFAEAAKPNAIEENTILFFKNKKAKLYNFTLYNLALFTKNLLSIIT